MDCFICLLVSYIVHKDKAKTSNNVVFGASRLSDDDDSKNDGLK